ncbi:MAG: phage portal protein [Oscillospiraceae bacterium]|nr:phage portal protein [Oscillospiraceae bacterium]
MTLENYTVKEILRLPAKGLTGRRKIRTAVREITLENVREVLEKALTVHSLNCGEITYLWEYYKGSQDIQFKEKFVRESINNIVTVNRANEIVTFKTAYLLNEPIQYISHGGEDAVSEKVERLNELMRAEDKESKDKEIVDWMHICGVAERLILPDAENDQDGAPFCIYTLDPREAFVIYSARIGERPMAGVVLQVDEKERQYATVYTKNRVFEVTREAVREIGAVEDEEGGSYGHLLGDVPLVEYENNSARMGAFETVIPILNNINRLESDAVDSVQDFVNGFDVFQNCEIEDGDYSQLSLGGKAVKIKTVVQGMEAKVYRVASELNQSGVQQRVDDLTEAYLTICGMPNRNGGSSTSDTGQAVIFRDGWSEAESRAKDTEKLFTRSERRFLRVALNICAARKEGDCQLGLELKDIGVNFARKSLNNLQSRFQCMSEGLGNSFMHPMDVYNAFGDIFGDKTAAYRRGMAWHTEQEEKRMEALDAEIDRERVRAKERTKSEEQSPTGGDGGRRTSSTASGHPSPEEKAARRDSG